MGNEPLLGFLQGGGRMGAMIRDYNWSRSPLGRPEHWPQSLRSVGLSMIYGFVRQSGGHVSIESRLGRGTQMTLCFPR